MSAPQMSLPEPLAAAVKAKVADWQSGGKMQRLWQGDARLWTGSDGRRALRVHLGSNLKAGLATLQTEVQKALEFSRG